MMRMLVILLALLAGSLSAASAATVAVATSNVNLRAGPSTAYPALTVVPAGASIVTHGCIRGYTWCDIAFGSFRGWVSAGYIQVVYRGAPVVLTPAVAPVVGVVVVPFGRAYWDTWYAAYPWYGHWAAYYRPVPVAPAPRVTDVNRSVTCTGAGCTASRSATGYYGGSASQSRSCAGGECTATRSATGPYGASASRTRTCNPGDQSCSVTRTGPRGATGTRVYQR